LPKRLAEVAVPEDELVVAKAHVALQGSSGPPVVEGDAEGGKERVEDEGRKDEEGREEI
jgi:hypothetical protein